MRRFDLNRVGATGTPKIHQISAPGSSSDVEVDPSGKDLEP